MRKNLGVHMTDSSKREAWLQELKELRKELVTKAEPLKNSSAPQTSQKGERSYQKSIPGLMSKMYESNKESAKVQILMLALITFVFETLFFLGSYLLFHK